MTFEPNRSLVQYINHFWSNQLVSWLTVDMLWIYKAPSGFQCSSDDANGVGGACRPAAPVTGQSQLSVPKMAGNKSYTIVEYFGGGDGYRCGYCKNDKGNLSHGKCLIKLRRNATLVR